MAALVALATVVFQSVALRVVVGVASAIVAAPWGGDLAEAAPRRCHGRPR